MRRFVVMPTAPRAQLAARVSRVAAVAALVVSLSLSSATGQGPFGGSQAFAAGSCTGWTSQSAPPPTIRVLRTSGPASGTVQTVPFHDYVTAVEAAEWLSTNPTEALKAGAVAAKEFAWYYTMVWRGRTAADGSCYDVVDNTNDQLYAPETIPPVAAEIAAVDATWGMTVLKNGSLFITHYQGGALVPCGTDADGGHLYQHSAMDCARSGMPAETILLTYYGPDATIVGSGGAAGPGVASALQFSAQPAGGVAGGPLPIQPVVVVVDSLGQPVTSGAGATVAVTLSLAGGVPGATLACNGGLTRAAVGGIAAFDGCTISSAGSGYAVVAGAGGLAGATTAPFAVSQALPTITLVATPPTGVWGKAAQLTAQIVPPAGAATPAGLTVHLERSFDGQAFTPVADLVADAAGVATFAERPATNVFYRVAFDGTADLSAAASPVLPLAVRELALLRPDNGGIVRRIARGRTVTFTTLVRPATVQLPAGPVVFRVYQLVSGVWTLRRTATVAPDASGLATLPVTFTVRGHWYVRTMALATTGNAASLWSPVQRYDVV